MSHSDVERSLQTLIKNNQIKTQSNGVRDITHTLFSGGKLSLENEEELHKIMEEAHKQKIDMYVNELKTFECYRMFLDIDLKLKVDDVENLSKRLDDTQIDDLTNVIHMAVRRFFPKEAENSSIFRYVVCDADVKLTEKDCAKYGIHFHMPSIVVRQHEALLMREAILEALKQNLSTWKLHNSTSWEDILDNKPFIASRGGLRMVGSLKTSICPECKDKPKAKIGCSACKEKGKIDERRPYELRSV